jgi:NAD dependent epimerase/dehydratase family enzyme
VPTLALKALYGEMSITVTTGQRSVPTRLVEAGYVFQRPDLEAALREVTGDS